MMAYRSSVHETTKCTPNLLFFGRETNLPVDLLHGSPPESPPCPVAYVEWVKLAIQQAYHFVEENTRRSASRRKLLYNRNCGYPKFQIGDTVWRYYPPMAKLKFGKGWQGPYLIVGYVSDLVYSIQKSKASAVLNVHIDHLKLYEGKRPLIPWTAADSSEADPEVEPIHNNPETPAPPGAIRFPNKSSKNKTKIPPPRADGSLTPEIRSFSLGAEVEPPVREPDEPLPPSPPLNPCFKETEVLGARRTGRARKPAYDPQYEYDY